MASYAEPLVRLLAIKKAAELLGLHWHTVKTIDHQRLEREVRPPELRQLRRLIMDGFALFKGRRYATVAICADAQQVLWIGEGRGRQAQRARKHEQPRQGHHAHGPTATATPTTSS